jgi:hypothetical protein
MPEPSKARIADSMAGNPGVAARHAAKRGAVLPLPEKAATRLSDGHSDTYTAEEGDDTGPEDSEAGSVLWAVSATRPSSSTWKTVRCGSNPT